MSLAIVHVVRQYTPSVGGMENVVANLARQQLLRQGHRPTIITLNRIFSDPARVLDSEAEVDGVLVRRLEFSGSRRYPFCPTVLNEIQDADLVHVHGVDFFFDYLAFTRAVHHKPLVASTHGGFFHTRFMVPLKHLYFNTVSRAASKAYLRVIATSDSDGAIFERIVSHPRLEVIENGVDIERYHGAASTFLRPAMLYFGRWASNKGLPEAIRLFSRLHVRNPDWSLTIAGREFDLKRSDLEALRRQSGVAADAIRIVAGPTDAQLRSLIGEASFFIGLSSHEGFGLSAIEAMSAGLIPILSGIPPFRKVMEQCPVGIIADESEESTAVRIESLLAQGQTPHEAAQKVMESFVRRYAWEGVAKIYEQSYARALHMQ